MILHIHDSQSLFINLCVSCFEEANIPGFHIVIGTFKSKEYTNVKFLKLNSKEYKIFFNEIKNKYSFVLFHSLLGSCEKTLLYMISKKIDIRKGWVIYGAEIQKSRIIPSSFLGNVTRFYYYFLLPYRVFIPFFRIFKILTKKNLNYYLNFIEYYAHFMPEEIDKVKAITKINKPTLWHSYIMVESYFDATYTHHYCIDNGGIFIGNSASFTSNHMEAFRKVKSVLKQSNDRRIVVPLSYGNKVYSSFIQRKGKKIFSDNFVPLTEFVEKDAYHSILMSCSVMILNHKRQQGLGNLIAGAWYGMRVYICEESSSYLFFKRMGLNIFSIERDFHESNPDLFDSLSMSETIHNRRILTEIFGEATFISSLRSSFCSFISNAQIINEK